MSGASVREQYEAYPYPARDPREEAKRLITGSPSNLAEVNHYLFGGARDFARPFRALVAGGGTGDAAIMLAQQLADAGPAGRVVYLDLSEKARAIAEARAAARGLDNIAFHSGSLFDIAEIAPGPYDYIDCCGVLHHLEDPPAGLAALKAVLAEDGGMGIMVYGEYGRFGVYPVQDMLKQIGGDLDLPAKVTLARRLLKALPATNPLRRNPFIGDHQRSDAELVDLLLHSHDRAYTVPQLLELIDGAGLSVTGFIEPMRYDPALLLSDAALKRNVESLDARARWAFAERLAGNMKIHIAYVSAAPEATVARPDDPAMVPLLIGVDAQALAKTAQKDLSLKAEAGGLAYRFALPRLAPAIIQRIDGENCLGDIHRALAENDRDLDWERFRTIFAEVYRALNGMNRLFLKRG